MRSQRKPAPRWPGGTRQFHRHARRRRLRQGRPEPEATVWRRISTTSSRSSAEGLSARVSYVYKNLRNEWAEVDLARVNVQTSPSTRPIAGPTGFSGTRRWSTRSTTSRLAPATTACSPTRPIPTTRITSTVELSVNRRFRNNWMSSRGPGTRGRTSSLACDFDRPAGFAAGNAKA